MSDLRERRFTMDSRSGRILDATPQGEPPGRPPKPEERWRSLGEIDPTTGRLTVDYSEARRWRPIEEFWQW